MKKEIRISPDFFTSSLWWDGPPAPITREIDIESLPLSQKTIERLRKWQSWYNSTFISDYPPDSSFSSPDEQRSFWEEGYELWKQIQDELGQEYTVSYYDLDGNTLKPNNIEKI